MLRKYNGRYSTSIHHFDDSICRSSRCIRRFIFIPSLWGFNPSLGPFYPSLRQIYPSFHFHIVVLAVQSVICPVLSVALRFNPSLQQIYPSSKLLFPLTRLFAFKSATSPLLSALSAKRSVKTQLHRTFRRKDLLYLIRGLKICYSKVFNSMKDSRFFKRNCILARHAQ